MNLPEIEEVRRISLKPGDVLLVRVDREISAAEAQQIKDIVQPKFPANEVLIADQRADFEVIEASP